MAGTESGDEGLTGTVKKALVDITGEAVEDLEAKMRMYLARQ